MDAETRGRIFEPFFTTKEPDRGTGLGLATVHGIVRDAGGDIGVETEPGRGTTFTIHMPKAAPVAATSTAESPQVRTGSETILVVGDDPLVRLTVRGYLEPLGYTVLHAADANEASMFFQRGPDKIDLLITDVMLPGATGPEIAADADRYRPGLPRLFMSAYGREALRERVPLPEHAVLLQKPFTALELGAELVRVFGARHKSPPLRPPGAPPPRPVTSDVLVDTLAARTPADGATLLLVEDGATTRAAMRELFELHGHRVIDVPGGAEALAASERHDGIDVIVTDVGLPDMPAAELVRRLRARLPRAAVVYISGKDEEDADVRALPRDGRTTFVQKPVDVAILSKTITALLS